MKKNKLYGFDLLRQQTITSVLEVVDDYESWIVGDSEIERLLCAALSNRITYGCTEFTDFLIPRTEVGAENYFLEERYKSALIMRPQVQIEAFRVDFVLSAWTFGTIYSRHNHIQTTPHWRHLVIECDGHNFHERTKEQAAKDRSRDRELTNLGYEVYRFTGSEIWTDPWDCADQLYAWAIKGW